MGTNGYGCMQFLQEVRICYCRLLIMELCSVLNLKFFIHVVRRDGFIDGCKYLNRVMYCQFLPLVGYDLSERKLIHHRMDQ